MTLIIESDTGPATQEDAASWASQYGLTFPVLADPNKTLVNYIRTDPNFSGGYGLPNKQLLSPGMQVEMVNGSVTPNDFIPFLDEE
mgnify:CR=1 FL=1